MAAVSSVEPSSTTRISISNGPSWAATLARAAPRWAAALKAGTTTLISGLAMGDAGGSVRCGAWLNPKKSS
jgi:hypothetical protein